MSRLPNSYPQKRPPVLDPSHLPPQLREAYDKPVPLRPGETDAILVADRGLRVGPLPGARLFAQRLDDGRVGINVVDERGIEPLLRLWFNVPHLEPLLRQLILLYHNAGGDVAALLPENTHE